jgi:hypothetical protein
MKAGSVKLCPSLCRHEVVFSPKKKKRRRKKERKKDTQKRGKKVMKRNFSYPIAFIYFIFSVLACSGCWHVSLSLESQIPKIKDLEHEIKCIVSGSRKGVMRVVGCLCNEQLM